MSSHLQNGIETAKLVWSRIPNAEDGEPDTIGLTKPKDDGNVESLDYEVIENIAYWEEQVVFLKFLCSILGTIVLGFLCLWFLGILWILIIRVCFEIYRRKEGSSMLDIVWWSSGSLHYSLASVSL